VVLIIFALISLTSLQPGWAETSRNSELIPEAPAQAPSLWVTPLELVFEPLGVSKTSEIQVVTITNNGDSTLANFSGGVPPAPFHSSNNCANGVLAGNSCEYSFWVIPSTVGTFNASITVSTNAGPFTVTLQAQVIGAELSVSPLALDFGTILATATKTLDLTADQQIVVVRNTGVSNLSEISEGEVSPPFEVNNNCPASLPPAEACQFYYNFFPSEAGTYTETSTVSTNAGTFTIKLTGIGSETNNIQGQRATPLELDFGPMGVGTTSDPQSVTITNLSITDTIQNLTIGNPGAPFSISENCEETLPPSESCQQTLSFSPTTIGEHTATYTTTSSAGTFMVTLHGKGIGAELHVTPLVLDFGPVLTGTTSAPQSVVVKNTGIATLTGISGGGIAAPFEGSKNCNDTLAPGETCQYTFYFKPTVGGQFTTTSTTTTNIGSFKISLIGGMQAPITEKEFIPDKIRPGGVSTLQISIKNPNPAATLFHVEIGDNFPAGMVVASPLNFTWSPGCGTPTFSPVAGKNSFVLSDATILGNQVCIIRLNVTAPTINTYTNTTGAVSSRYVSGKPASAILNVGYFNYLPYTIR
jgi:hypothetical protein